MANKTEVMNRIEDAIIELNYIQSEVEDIEGVETGEIDISIVIKFISDAKDSIEKIRDSFEEYHEEVSDVEDDLEGLVKRLSEVLNNVK